MVVLLTCTGVSAQLPPVPFRLPALTNRPPRRVYYTNVTLAWDPSPGDVTGYVVGQGPGPRYYTNLVDFGDALVGTLRVPEGTNWFSVKAYNWPGVESDWCEEIGYVVPRAPAKTNSAVFVVWRGEVSHDLQTWTTTNLGVWAFTNPTDCRYFRAGQTLIWRTNW